MRHLIITGICLASLSFNLSSSASETVQELGLHRLAGVGYFAFGPVGAGETVSAGENQFRALCEQEFAEAYFVELFQRGTPEGKCYALVGLHELSSEFFAKYADAFRKTAPTYISVIEGRVMRQDRASAVLAAIEAGRFAGYFKSKQA